MKFKLLFLMSTLALTGCQFGNHGWTTLSPSVGENTGPPNEDFMYLDLNEDFYDSLGVEPPLYEINTTDKYGDSARRESVSNCEILYDEEEPASPELICILDYMEQEFLLYDLSFVLNIPKGMCINLITTPSWHYDRPTGYGPQTIVHTKIAGTNDTERDQYCVQGTSNCTDDAGSIPELCNRYVYTRGEENSAVA